MSTSPLMVMAEFVTPENMNKAEFEVAKIQELPEIKTLGELKTPNYENDPTELIRHRFLYLGGVLLVPGPTGIGKSAFVMQMAIHFAAGRTLFGLEPGNHFLGGMKILVIQAENDEGDMAEMRDGVLRGCTDLTQDDKEKALRNIEICTINDQTSDTFTATMGRILQERGPFNLVIVDPALAYLGGDSNAQKDVSHFMRELLNPLLKENKVGLILVHHTNKPPSGKEKSKWQAGDFAYLGAGSAEWTNPVRAVLGIRSVGSDKVFELIAAKRGKRLRWLDGTGVGTTKKLIAHATEPGVICWHEATEDEKHGLEADHKPGRPKTYDPFDVLDCVAMHPGQNQKFYMKCMAEVLLISKTTAQSAIRDCLNSNYLKQTPRGNEATYTLTPEGRSAVKEHLTVTDWSNWTKPDEEKKPTTKKRK